MSRAAVQLPKSGKTGGFSDWLLPTEACAMTCHPDRLCSAGPGKTVLVRFLRQLVNPLDRDSLLLPAGWGK